MTDNHILDAALAFENFTGSNPMTQVASEEEPRDQFRFCKFDQKFYPILVNWGSSSCFFSQLSKYSKTSSVK